ncbi:MAG: hypothetical protein KA715_11065 [Xanthomonadaceae bacterium]|nr:hypothetical protein [Xanthomonadaceae bacterium]
MKLYLVHCGFYDMELCEGIYESHINLMVVAESFDGARQKVRQNPKFKKKRMHVDGLQEIVLVDGFNLNLTPNFVRTGETELISNRHRDL